MLCEFYHNKKQAIIFYPIWNKKILKGSRVKLAVTEVNRAVRESFDLGVLLVWPWGPPGASVPSSMAKRRGRRRAGRAEALESTLTPEREKGRLLGCTPCLEPPDIMDFLWVLFICFDYQQSITFLFGENSKLEDSFVNIGYREGPSSQPPGWEG